uniref:Uncharacterized protein n=1 Tax=Arundo donax TaxID=35708 RepID=A0A0A9CKY8_ARUDO
MKRAKSELRDVRWCLYLLIESFPYSNWMPGPVFQ